MEHGRVGGCGSHVVFDKVFIIIRRSFTETDFKVFLKEPFPLLFNV
jgi:hypothetical protein